jgi:hypothetical protein
MIRIYRKNPGEDILLTASDGLSGSTVHLTHDEADLLVKAVFRLVMDPVAIDCTDIETTGLIQPENSHAEDMEEDFPK